MKTGFLFLGAVAVFGLVWLYQWPSEVEGLSPNQDEALPRRANAAESSVDVTRELAKPMPPAKDTSDPLVLELHPERSITIRALDQYGTALPGVIISCSLLIDGNALDRTQTEGTTSDPEGTLTWPTLGLFLHSEKNKGNAVAGIRLQVKIAGGDDVIKDFSPVPADGSTIDLQLPPTGSLMVRLLDDRGRLVPGKSGIIIASLEVDPVSGKWRKQSGGYQWSLDGYALFPAIALDQLFEVKVENLQATMPRREILGPTQNQPQVTCDLRLDSDFAILRGRVVDAAGQPLAEHTLSRLFRYGKMSVSNFVWTGSDGSFLMPLSDAETGTDLAIAELQVGAFPTTIDLSDRSPFAPGITELGDLVFEEQSLLLSGRFIAPDDSNCGYFGLTVERRASPAGEWERQPSTVKVDAGKFKVMAIPRTGEYRLLVNPRASSFSPLPQYGCGLPPEPITFVPGQTDLVVRIEAGHRLTVRTNYGGKYQQQYKFILRANSQAPNEGRSSSGIHRTEDGLFDVVWNDLPADTYDLEARIAGDDTPFRTIQSIQVPGPDQTLDLSEDLQKFTLRLIYPGIGKNREPATVFLLRGNTFGHASFEGRAEIVVTMIPEAFDALLLAPGCEPVLIKALHHDMDIALHPSQSRFEIHIREVPKLPADIGLRVRISSTGEPHSGWQVPQLDNKDVLGFEIWGLAETLEKSWPAHATALFDNEGVAELTVRRLGPQNIIVKLFARSTALRARWGRASIQVPGISPNRRDLQASTAMQTLWIDLPTAALQDALRRAGSR